MYTYNAHEKKLQTGLNIISNRLSHTTKFTSSFQIFLKCSTRNGLN